MESKENISNEPAPPPYTPKPPPPPQAWEPPPGYQPYQGPTQPPPWQQFQPNNYGATAVTVHTVHPVAEGWRCPACMIGVLEDDYTCLGIFCAIFFFPLGILACLLLKNRRCSNCGAYFG